MRALTVMCLVALSLMTTTTARADLMADADRLVSRWQQNKSQPRRETTIFLHEGELRRVPFSDGRSDKRTCVAVVAMGERHARFAVTTEARDEPVESRAGVVRLTDCGDGPLTLPAASRHVSVTMTHGRGAIEVLSVAYETQVTPVDVVLPERAVGQIGADGSTADTLRLAPMKERVERARRTAWIDGARTIVPMSMKAADDGVGSALVELGAGCHRLSVIADTGQGGSADVDAEVRRHADAVVLSRDRSHAPDARLEACVATTTRVEVRFTGAPKEATVALLDAAWPIPSGVPGRWGEQATAGLAWALHRRHTPAPKHAPLFVTLGAPGVTMLPVPIIGGACYVAAMALARGQATTSRLSVRLAKTHRYDDANDLVRSAAVSFCAGPEDDVAQIVADVRARDAWWVGVIWQIASAPPSTGVADAP